MTDYGHGSIKFLLADDHNIVRQGIKLIIGDLIEDCQIYHASSIQQIREQIKLNPIDFAILDAQLPDGNCLSLIPEIRQLQPDMKILMFTSFDEENYSFKFINAGANGFLSKLSEESEIRQAISQLMEKGEYYSPLTQKLLKISERNPDILNPLSQLSERELQIAVLYSKGYGNLEIANSLSLKQNTISTFKKRIFEKLNIETLVDLINLMEIHHTK